MYLLDEIHNLLRTVYMDCAINGDTEVNALVKRLQRCIEMVNKNEVMEPSELETSLDSVRTSTHAFMSSSAAKHYGASLRQIYTDSCITHCLLELYHDEKAEGETAWLKCVRLLDGAIVFSGAPDRMDVVQRLIMHIQETKLAPLQSFSQEILTPNFARNEAGLPSCGREVPRVEEPDMISFLTTWCKSPFVISGGVGHWPALTTHPWASLQYLKEVAGRGRMVPVEIGKDYRLDSWSQEMMDWEDFLERVEAASEPLVYLAQHSLFTQFPELREDIRIPDFVYYSPTAEYERYSPPNNEDELIINAWLGPKGTLSPAHQVIPSYQV